MYLFDEAASTRLYLRSLQRLADAPDMPKETRGYGDSMCATHAREKTDTAA